jgi:hypothetical protein
VLACSISAVLRVVLALRRRFARTLAQDRRTWLSEREFAAAVEASPGRGELAFDLAVAKAVAEVRWRPAGRK